MWLAKYKKDYLQETKSVLLDENIYDTLDSDPTMNYSKKCCSNATNYY